MRQIDDTTASSLSTPMEATAAPSQRPGLHGRHGPTAVPISPARSPATGSWRICAACSVRPSARTAGKWRKSAASPPLRLPVFAEPRRVGRRRRPRRAAYSMQHLGVPTACWSSTKPGFSRKAGTRRAWLGSIVARPGKWTTAKSASSEPSPLGQVLLDRELYLPQEWTNDRERCCRPAFRRAGALRPSRS